MPEVDVPANLTDVFNQARAAAAGQPPSPPGPQRHVVIVTPGRMLMFRPCPPSGSVPEAQVSGIQRMIPPQPPRRIVAIAYTELEALKTDPARTIPFLGMLIGIAYIGHAVWVFEGHSSALADGCRGADVLFVDSGMLPHLQADWTTVAASVMARPEIYVHDRATFGLRPQQVKPKT